MVKFRPVCLRWPFSPPSSCRGFASCLSLIGQLTPVSCRYKKQQYKAAVGWVLSAFLFCHGFSFKALFFSFRANLPSPPHLQPPISFPTLLITHGVCLFRGRGATYQRRRLVVHDLERIPGTSTVAVVPRRGAVSTHHLHRRLEDRKPRQGCLQVVFRRRHRAGGKVRYSSGYFCCLCDFRMYVYESIISSLAYIDF